MKGIFDGVICALQAHTDTAVLPDVAERLAATLPADPEEIAKHLLDQRRAVLDIVPQLVKPFRDARPVEPGGPLVRCRRVAFR